MKCPLCGAYNKPEYNKCVRCGNDLASDGDGKNQEKIILEHHSPLKNTPSFREAVIVEEVREEVQKDIKPGTHVPDQDENDLWHGKKKKRHADRNKKHVPVLSLKDESDTPDEKKEDVHKTRTKKRAQSGSNLHKISNIREGQEVEVLIPPEVKKKKKKEKKKRKYNIRWGRLSIVSITAAVLIIGMVIGFIYLFRGVLSGVTDIFASREGLPNDGKPIVERVMINGQTWHRVTFYGEDGERILVDDPVRSLSIEDNKAVLLLDDTSFIPETDVNIDDEEVAETDDEVFEEPGAVEEVGAANYVKDGGYVRVALKAALFTEDGEEKPLYVEPYNIPVPLSPLKLVYPTDPDLVVEYTQVFVKIKTTLGSRVIIDGVNLTDEVDSLGFVEKFVNLNEGLNEIKIVTETTKHRTNTEYIYVTRPEQDVSIELDSPNSSHREKDIWIEGTTEENATIYVDTLHLSANVSEEGFVTNDETGEVRKKFKFRYVLSSYGWNEIKIQATTPDGRSSTLVHRVERDPDHREYTKQAWNILDNYDWLSSSTEALVGKIFSCRGEVIEREDTDTDRLYLFNVGTESQPRYVMLKYTGKQNIKIGETYDMYADVVGTYKNYPMLTVRFVYDWTPPEETEETAETTETP